MDSLSLGEFKDKLSLRNHAYYLATPSTTTIDSIVQSLETSKNIKPLSKFNFGYNDTTFWLLLPVKKFPSNKEKFLLEIQNPHIDLLQAWCVTGSTITPLGKETGDMRLFNTRYVQHRNFIWSLNDCGSENFTLIIRIEKRKSSLNIPAFLWTESAHRNHSTRAMLFFGISFGMMLLVMIYSIIAGLLLNSPIYFRYALFVLTSIIFLATYEGLSFQVLYPNWSNFNSLFRMVINGLASITFVFFSQEFLNIKKYSILLNRVLNSIIIVFIALIIATPFFKYSFLDYGLFLIPIVLTLSGSANILLFMAAIKLFPTQRKVSAFYLVAYSAIIVAGIISIMADFGLLEILPFNPLFMGVLIEILVFSWGLSYLMKKVYEERNELMQRIHRHQKEMVQAYVAGIEKERERIAGELHDDVGSRLSNLRRLVNLSKTENLEFIENEIATLSDDVRNLSHQMLPTAMHYKGLAQLVADLISQLKKTSPIEYTFQCYDIPDTLPENQVHQLYRIIQEVLNNIARHSQASHADIQLFGHDNELVVTIEDNGVGFDVNARGGMGLTQMKARTEALNGKLEINSSAAHGTSLLITVPLVRDDKNN